ncbi:MAG TPA: iron-containing alcohol dehydrogenase, partial [Clostridia bacterium]|nr:iron-containing alcohol dehydrogenase [Clostridia bacterium]
MRDFVFYSPTKVVFGRDAETQTGKLAREIGALRVLIVYGGGSVVRSGLLERVEAALSAEGIAFERCGGVQPNPRLAFAEEAVRQALRMKADCILAVGGGSAIDTAKAVAIGAANPDIPIWNFWAGEATVAQSLPVGCVLTIPAAGSETSDSSVLTNEATGIKRGLSTPWNRPKFAVMNPALAMTLPKYQISCGVADILMHTLDRYFTHTKDNALTDAFAEALLRTTLHYGVAALENPQDYNAMSELMWCGSLSHNSLTGLGAETDFGPHKLGHELSAMFDVAHGVSLTAVWGAWARHV